MPKITRQFSILSAPGHVQPHRHERRSIGAHLLSALKTFLFVAPLTLLIWIYADRELIVKSDIGVIVQVKSSQSNRIVTLLSPPDGQIQMDLEGSQSSIETVRDELLNRREPLVLLLPEDVKPGNEVDVDAINIISQTTVFANSPVQVARVRPAIRVRVETRVSKTVKIIQNPNTRFVGEVKFEPESVDVSGPAGEIEKLPENTVLLADMTRFQTLAPGEYIEQVPVVLSASLPRIEVPKTVSAKIKILESKPVVLQAIPILIQVPARVLELGRYHIKVEQVTLPNIKVSGPPEVIEQITKGNFSPAAVIEFSVEEATTSGENKKKTLGPANYRMPKDVSVMNPEQDITFTVIDRGPEIR